MNMQKALQHLYKAVSGEETRKVNISKLLVDIHKALTGKDSANRNNWARIIDSMAENWSGGGGDGYLGIHTATVNVTFDTSEIEGEITGIISAYITLYSGDNGAVNFAYSSDCIPTAELGSPAQMLIPISDTYPAVIDSSSLGWEINDNAVMIAEATVVSGSATGAIVSGGSGAISITGDCTLNIKVMYQD